MRKIILVGTISAIVIISGFMLISGFTDSTIDMTSSVTDSIKNDGVKIALSESMTMGNP